MSKGKRIVIKSLKEQVYEYIREEIHSGRFLPGATINMNLISEKLGISKTPLRDALIQLEMEGFVTISPRRGVYVNPLTLDDIRNIYQVIGALEASALTLSFQRIGPKETDRMQRYNDIMFEAVEKDHFDRFYAHNLKFHNVFVDLSENRILIKTIHTLKNRLYDFPKVPKWIKEWEQRSIECHQKILDAITSGDMETASYLIHRDHWAFDVQAPYIKQYYFGGRQAGSVSASEAE